MTDVDANNKGPWLETSRMVSSGSVQLYVAEYVGEQRHDIPVLLIHGWPDSGTLWQPQIQALVEAGFRVIVPDQRGFGRSDRPTEVKDYLISEPREDMIAVLDAFDVPVAHVVGHDWGATVAWQVAIFHPERVKSLAALSVPHPRAPMTLRQAEMSWYMLFFQFEGIAEATIQADDWAWLRWFSRDHIDLDRAIEDLSRPGALTASLNWYRANLAPRMPGPLPELPPVTVPTMGVWSDGDHHLDGERMALSGELVSGPWRHEVISDSSHWISIDAPDQLNAILLDWLLYGPAAAQSS
ncbi:alpha/beta fold hydrolase [Streptomyces sp. NPDC094038]|uniref:alpha/beta fold hydrolase n=1 Tax=Streptomyces sp. NPDC094038 TaxID=3366055 RepID=UPI0037FEF815